MDMKLRYDSCSLSPHQRFIRALTVNTMPTNNIKQIQLLTFSRTMFLLYDLKIVMGISLY